MGAKGRNGPVNRWPTVLILHNRVAPDARRPGDESVSGALAEVQAVAAALKNLSIRHRVADVTRLDEIPSVLAASPEPIVFNLVETLAGDPQDTSYVPALCRAFGKSATGCDTPCMALTLDKTLTKAVLENAGLPVPAGVTVAPGQSLPPRRGLPPGPYIVKPALSDASEGIHSASSFFPTVGPGLRQAVARVHADFRQPALVEQFVGTRELNISLLQRGPDIIVLPPAEIEFLGFGPDRPRIIDYAAKWLGDSFECRNTMRRIPAPVSRRTAASIRAMALQAWRALDCRDFIRIDLRMDARERVTILEVNANPDISPDAGFAAALAAGGYAYETFVEIMISNAVQRLGSGAGLKKVRLPARR